MPQPLKILLVSAEVAPIVSTGELGRSVGGLAKALKSLEVDIRVVMPRYQNANIGLLSLVRLVPEMMIRTVDRFKNTAIYRDELPGEVPVYLVEKDRYFERDYLYGPPGEAYADNVERFCFFNLASLEMFTQIGFFPDVIHCHDWHTGLIPAYLKTLFHHDPLYAPIKTLFTVHDLRHQGCFPKESLSVTGLPETVFTPAGLEFYGDLCFLKSGIVYADILSTESKRYRQDIQTKEWGRGLEGVFQMRSKDLYGVVNGVDYGQYDPRLDPHIVANYTKDDLANKRACKLNLLESCGLKPQVNMPVIAMIAPLHEDKGIDVLIDAFDEMMKLPIRFVFLNDTEDRNTRYASKFGELMGKYRRHVRCYTEYDEQLKHKILAGADIIVFPFQSEPCGINQMYALKYGTIPLVRATGGLDDTVTEFSLESGKGTGFKFVDYTAEAFLTSLREALAVYDNRTLWDLLQANAMRVNYSWVYSAKKYLDLYKLVLNRQKIPDSTNGNGGK